MNNVFDGEQLRQLRKDKNLSTQQVADIIGISQSYLSRFENNKAIPDIDMLASILKVYDVSIVQFFGNQEEVPDHIQELITTSKELTAQQVKVINEMIKTLRK